MIEVQNLVKHYGDKKAVNDISFRVEKGEVLGFLGPNGAGKSTTMNMLTGYISSNSGHIKINDVDLLENPIKAKSQIGYLPEIPPLYLDMTVRGYLDFIYDLKKCKISRRAHIKEICELTKITDVFERIIGNLSKGYKQRVGLAQALIGNPPVLILDEPTVGLDPKQILEIRTLIKKLGKSHTVILSSHIMQEIQAVCDRIIIINNGVIMADDTEHNLSLKVSTDHRITVRIEGEKEKVIKIVKTLKQLNTIRADVEKEPGVYEYDIEAREGYDIRRDLFEICAANKMPILMLKSATLSLEDIFLKVTTGESLNTTGRNSDKNSGKKQAEEMIAELEKKKAANIKEDEGKFIDVSENSAADEKFIDIAENSAAEPEENQEEKN
jgi:ABC-2 type transport system ATP-binding protein